MEPAGRSKEEAGAEHALAAERPGSPLWPGLRRGEQDRGAGHRPGPVPAGGLPPPGLPRRQPPSALRLPCALRRFGAAHEGAASGEATLDAIPVDSGDGTSSRDVADDGDSDAQEEARVALRAEPPELTFRQFHERLWGYFGTRGGPQLPRGALSKHMETQIRLRRPRRLRRQHPTRVQGPDEGGREGPKGERVARLEEENSSLHELVEDLRAELQGSDARCLALQVCTRRLVVKVVSWVASELQAGPRVGRG
ncbi:Hypothetical predicted protein [Marmota monax]|uniref:Uncharacterized protein n=1 Tax=Marmota monax TaxID=9995 RepID=A0A5E4D1Z0_MARMO|nr:Hypothetical predicted protein [Marmota monax]